YWFQPGRWKVFPSPLRLPVLVLPLPPPPTPTPSKPGGTAISSPPLTGSAPAQPGGGLDGRWHLNANNQKGGSSSPKAAPDGRNPTNPVWDPRVTFIRNRVKDVGANSPNKPFVFPDRSEGGGNPGYLGGNFMIVGP
ncbi:MAG TPA: hypothetical protein PKV86_16125, partial [Syntrophobacteraceae bacterium]|nr:hypothetical protein [Syntrophobacteraceae bacterium]